MRSSEQAPISSPHPPVTSGHAPLSSRHAPLRAGYALLLTAILVIPSLAEAALIRWDLVSTLSDDSTADGFFVFDTEAFALVNASVLWSGSDFNSFEPTFFTVFDPNIADEDNAFLLPTGTDTQESRTGVLGLSITVDTDFSDFGASLLNVVVGVCEDPVCATRFPNTRIGPTFGEGTLTPSLVPVPAALPLMATALLSLAGTGMHRRRRTQRHRV